MNAFVAGLVRARTLLRKVHVLTSAVTWLVLAGAMAIASPGAPEKAAASDGLLHITYHGQNYLVCEVDPKKDDVRFFWKDDADHLLRDFDGLEKYVAAKGEKLLFATNAGMFDPDNKPVGLFVQNGDETTPLNLNDGPGNFHMKPNGVFLINAKHDAMVVESSAYAGLLTPAVWATQSGPLLLQAGNIHPDFISDSKNVRVRSGVGVRKDGVIEFAISTGPVNFYDFALLFRSRLKCPNALYLDGDISAFHAPSLKDGKAHFFGPMIGIVAPAK